MKAKARSFGTFISATAFIVALTALFLWQSYRSAIDLIEHRVENITALIHNQLDQTFDRIDMVLDVHVNNFPLEIMERKAVKKFKNSVPDQMRRLVENSRSISGSYFFDANGDMLYTSDRNAKAANVSDRPFFKTARDHPEIRLAYSDALVARTTGRWSIVVARAVRGTGGQFLGVTTVLLDLEQEQKLVDQLKLPALTLLIRRSDTSNLMFRSPIVAELMNKPLPKENPIWHAVESASRKGTFNYVASTDGIHRISAFQVMDDYPFYVQTGFALDEALADWRRQAIWTASTVFAFLVIIWMVLRRMSRSEQQRDQALVETAELNRRYQSLYHDSPDAYLLMDTEGGTILDCNAAAERMLRGSQLQILGKTPDVLSPEVQPDGTPSRTGVQKISAQCLRDKNARFEWVHQRFDGEDFWAEVSISTVELDDKPVLFVAWRDISDRKRAEQQLSQMQETYRQFFEVNTSIKLVIDPEDGRIVKANDAAASYYGYPIETLQQMHIGQINCLPPAQIQQEMQRARQEQRLYFNFKHRLATGEIRDVEVYSGPATINDKTLLYSIIHDVTLKKQQEHQLSEQRRRLNDILEGTHVGTWEWNVQTGETVFNERWAEIIGYTLAELDPVTIDTWMKFAHPDDLKHSGELLEKHFSGELAYYECEARMKHKDGHWVWVLDRGKVASWTEDRKPLLMSGTHQDITDRKQADDELTRYRDHLEGLVTVRTEALMIAKEEAEAASRAKSTFLRNISHELLTPLNGIVGMTSLAQSRATEPRQGDQLKKALEAANRMNELIQRLLHVTELESGQFALSPTNFHLTDLLDKLHDLLSAAASAKGLDFAIQADASLRKLPLMGDHARLLQLLFELGSNAIKFTSTGSVSVSASAKYGAENEIQLRFEVADTGIGIEEKDRARIFNLFEQVDGSQTRRFGGTGIGLATCRQLARQMGGDIGLSSVPDRGSVFWLTVTLQREVVTAPT